MKTFHEWQQDLTEHSRGSKVVGNWFIQVESQPKGIGIDTVYVGNVYDKDDKDPSHITRDFDEPWKAMQSAEQWAQEN